MHHMAINPGVTTARIKELLEIPDDGGPHGDFVHAEIVRLRKQLAPPAPAGPTLWMRFQMRFQLWKLQLRHQLNLPEPYVPQHTPRSVQARLAHPAS